MRGHLPRSAPLNPIGLRSIHYCSRRIGQLSQVNHPAGKTIQTQSRLPVALAAATPLKRQSSQAGVPSYTTFSKTIYHESQTMDVVSLLEISLGELWTWLSPRRLSRTLLEPCSKYASRRTR